MIKNFNDYNDYNINIKLINKTKSKKKFKNQIIIIL